MRIALVVERFQPDGGGVERVAWQVAHGLAEAGDQVHVVARKGLQSPQIQLRLVPVPSFWQPLRVVRFSQQAARATQRDRYDAVHSFSRTLHQDIFRAGGGSHAEYMRRSYSARGARLREFSPRHRVLLGIERRVFEDPSQLVQCSSLRLRDEIASEYGVDPPRLRVVPNGVDTEQFHPDRVGREKLRSELGAKDRPVWLFAGSGWRRKGLDTALRALALSGSGSTLWIAGRDAVAPWRRLSNELGIAARVRFLGLRSDLESIYPACDGLLLPTRYDAFANVCLEAAASGIPVVTSAANGAAEALGEDVRVVEHAEDASSFAAALDELADVGARRSLGERARERAQRLTWRSHVNALRTLYREVAQ